MADSIQQGFDDFFGSIDSAVASSQILGQDIPLLGNDLANIAPTPPKVFQDVQAAIDKTLAALPTGASAADIAAALNGAGVNGLAATVTGANADQVAITLQAKDPVALQDAGVAIDTGVPAIGLDATANFAGKLAPTLNVALNYDTASQSLTLADAGTGDLGVQLDVGVDASADAKLGPLGVSIATPPTTLTAPAKPQVSLGFAVDLAAGADGAVTAAKVTATGGVDLDLALKTDPILGTDAQGKSLLPTIGTDLSLQYTLGGTPTVALNDITVDLGSLIDQLAQTIAPVTQILAETPFKQILKGVLGPIPIINDAAHLIPPLLKYLDTVPDGGDGLINALDLAGVYFESTGDTAALSTLRDFAGALTIIQQVTNLLNSGGAGDLGTIDLGSITLTGDTSAAPAAAGATAPAGGTIANAVMPAPTVGAAFTSAGDAVAAANAAVAASPLFKDPVAYTGADGDQQTALATGLLGAAGAPGLSIPLLQDLHGTEIEQILLPALFPSATPATLISYTLPELSFSVSVPPGAPLFLPVVGPFGLTLGGTFGASLGFTVGYNTAGLTTGNPADGLFLATSPGEPDIASITAEVDAGLGVDLEVVQASINGGIKATVGAGLTQPEVPLDDFKSFIVPEGKLAAEVNVVLTVGFGPFSFTLSDNIADITIIDFSAGEAAGTIDQQAGLANYYPDPPGTMSPAIVLNAGYRASDRAFDKTDDDESFTISNATVGADGKPTTDTLDVSALGVEELFGAPGTPVTAIVESDLGKGNNTLTIAPDVTQSVNLTALDGNNTFTAGAGRTTIRAGDGDNTFYGGSGNDYFATGTGVNFFHAGTGPMAVDGDPGGHNQVLYDRSTAGVTVAPVAGQEGLFGSGGYAQGDYLENVQSIVGSAYDDHLTAQQDVDTTLDGGAGDDVLIGGDGDDLLIGGPGADYLDGRGGENGTSYITSRAGVVVDLAAGLAYGGDAEGDTLLNIQDLQGSNFDDVLIGTPGFDSAGNPVVNRIDGGAGDDVIDGDGGADYLEGGDGDDTIFASGDGDMLDGGSGQNTLTYADHTPVGGVGVTVDLATGRGGGADQIGTIAGADFNPQTTTYSTFQTLIGSSGEDVLEGDSNVDTIQGGAGDDKLVVGAGAATLIGGAAADTLIGGTATDGSGDGLVGGGGIATADYSDGDGVTVDLATGIGLRSTAEGDRLYGVANLVGSVGADMLTGDGGDNVIDPGLSRGTGAGDVNAGIDVVDGGGGTDTLKLDYSVGDDGGGMTGGFGTVAGQGSFRRVDGSGTSDGVDFTRISRLDVTGTEEGDTIDGGLGGDTIRSGGGADTIYEQGGAAVVEAGDGDDTIFYGTDASHNLRQSADGSVTSGPFFLDGGTGIDTLSISFVDDASARDSDIVLTGQDPTTPFYGTNLTLPDGSAITDFEIVKNVVTGNGNDTVRQPGDVDNTISTGFGQDLVAPGLGVDTIDGGYDFTIGKEISGPQTDAKTGKTYYNVLDQAAFLANGGDELDLDYSSYIASDGVVGTTKAVQSTIDARLNGYSIPVVTNDGTYTAGDNKDSFGEIERLNVIGSSQNDVLVGTVGGFATLPQSDDYDSLASKRGDDVLEGGAGDDILIGLSGSDVLDGGAGNDLLIGGVNDTARQTRQHEIDTLTGGAGADRFVLGTADGTFYDSVQNLGDNTTDLSTISVVNTTRAEITDFTPTDGDTIELYGKASDYVAVQNGTDTLIYDTNGSTDSRSYGLVAQIQNFSGFDLNASYVVYDAPATNGSATDVNGNPVSAATTDLRDAESGVAIAPVPSAPASGGSGAHPETASEDSKVSPAATPQAAAAGFTVTQDNNPQDLETALVPDAAAVGIDPSSQTITLSGNAAAFGTFSGDPFGLGSGIVLSTGKVTDIVGPNTFSEPAVAAVSKPLTFEHIGFVATDITVEDPFGNPVTYAGGGAEIYRVDLSGLGANLASLLLKDDNTAATDMGGGGVASGVAIDGIILSHTKLDASDLLPTDGTLSKTADATFNNPAFLARLDPDPLDFSAADLVFTPGTQKAPEPGFQTGPDLQGSVNGLVDNAVATLGTVDGGNNTGALSLGDGGSLGLNLTQPVDTTAPLYAYVAVVPNTGSLKGDGDLKGTESDQPIPGTASSSKAASGPLSTDFGDPGPQGDTTSLTYTFKTEPGAAVDTASFTFALFTQDLPLLAGSGAGDDFKITLNGVNLAKLSDGSAATIDNLESSPYGAQSPDLVLNTAADAPAHDITAVNAYTTPLTFVGALNPAGQTNTLVIQVADTGDGLLDSGILVKAGTFKAGAGPGGVTVTDPTSPLTVGGPAASLQVTVDPGPVAPTAPVTVTITPEDDTLDLGNGAGKAATITIPAGGPYTVDVPISAAVTGTPESGITGVASVAVTSADPRFNGTPVAPVVVDIASDATPPSAYQWKASVDGTFSDASKWTPTGVPAAADDAYVDATDPSLSSQYTVTVSDAEAVAALTTVAQATVAVADGGALKVGGAIVNAGTIELDGGSASTVLDLGAAYARNVTLSGGGHIILSDSAKNLIGTGAASAGTVLDNVDNAISGAGEIGGSYGLSLINEGVNASTGSAGGVIAATGAAHGLLLDDMVVTNHGHLADTGAGGLQLTADQIDDTFGTIDAAGAGAHVDLDDTSIRGGTLRSEAGGVFNVGSEIQLGGDAAYADDGNTINLDADFVGAGALDLQDGTAVIAADTVLPLGGLSITEGATAGISGRLADGTALVNDGAVAIASGSSFTLGGPLSGTGGRFLIEALAGLDLDTAVGASQSVLFEGDSGALVLELPASFAGSISGFGADDTLDLRGETAVSASYDASASTLTVTLADSTTQTFAFTGTATSFLTRSDGLGGSVVYAAAPATTAPPAGGITAYDVAVVSTNGSMDEQANAPTIDEKGDVVAFSGAPSD